MGSGLLDGIRDAGWGQGCRITSAMLDVTKFASTGLWFKLKQKGEKRFYNSLSIAHAFILDMITEYFYTVLINTKFSGNALRFVD